MHQFEKLSVPQGSIGIHWFEQNSYALKSSQGTVVLIDPYFPHDRPIDRFIHPLPPLDESQLTTDLVLLTHSHGDHTCTETLRRIQKNWPEARYIGPEESIQKILEHKFQSLEQLALDQCAIDGIEIELYLLVLVVLILLELANTVLPLFCPDLSQDINGWIVPF